MTMGGQHCCEYTHDVSSSRFDDIDTDVWQCPHTRYEDTQYCPLHLPKDAATREHIDFHHELSSQLETSEDKTVGRQQRFIGARLPEINLQYGHLGNTSKSPLDFRECEIEGQLDVRGAVIERSIMLDGATIHGPARFDDATITRPTHATEVHFCRGVRFNNATVERLYCQEIHVDGRCEFRGATVTGSIDFDDGSIDRLSFERVAIDGDLDLSELSTQGRVRLDGASVDGTVSMMRATLPNGLWGVGLTVSDGIRSGDTQFYGPVHLGDVTIKGRSRLNRVHFGDRTSFRNSKFEQLTASGVVFANEVEFDDAHIAVAKFEQLAVATPFRLTNAKFERCLIRPARVACPIQCQGLTAEELVVDLDGLETEDETLAINLQSALVNSGQLGQPPSGCAVYNLSESVLGDVSLESPHDRRTLGCYQFDRTTFEGFDFADLRPELDRAGWEIHGVDDDLETTLPKNVPPDESQSASTLETTYLRAKNGAKERGDDQAVSQFFRQEMRRRRHRHWEQVRSAGDTRHKFQAATRGVSSGLLALTTGYGELSRRVVFSSIATVCSFALMYYLLFDDELANTDGVLGYLVFSSQTFITFIIDSGPTQASMLLRALTVVEGFIGAFFVALFVFTLTRSVNR